MFKNYLKTALRNLLRYKGFTMINMISLTTGIVGCLVIALFVIDERKYDRHVPDNDRVFRIATERTKDGALKRTVNTPPMFATFTKQQFPEVEQTARIMLSGNKHLVETGEKQFYEEKGFITESAFFDIFPFKTISGSLKGSLDAPGAVVITEPIAMKYFGNTDVVGKPLYIDKDTLQVKAVVAAVPEHFHFDFNYLTSLATEELPAVRMESWGWQQFFTYIKLRPGVNTAAFDGKFKNAIAAKARSLPDPEDIDYTPLLQPLKDIHLYSSDFQYDIAKRGNAAYVKGLSIIAIFVLVIACFNFVNLATARSSRRAKEIGVRKVIGAGKHQLTMQFIGETVLLSVLSVLIAAGLTMLLLRPLNAFTGKSIAFNPFTSPLTALLLLAAGVVIGVVAGIYPALFLSRFKPIIVLKGLRVGGGGHSWLRQSLVVVQFALSTLLIVCTMVVFRQMKYLHNKELGFSKEQVLLFEVKGSVAEKPDVMKNELLRSPHVVAATFGYGFPGQQFATDGIQVATNLDKRHSAVHLMGDVDYIKTMGMQVVAGRDFSREFRTDPEKAFILNETAVREYGFGTPENALGKELVWRTWSSGPDSIKRGAVVGVVKDFHYTSLHEKVNPTVVHIYNVPFQMAVKIKTADIQNTIAFVKETWDRFNTGFPLEYSFMDDNFDRMYQAEDKLSTLLWIFTAMAIFVGCLGLFGLAAFSAEQRTKEIGIRKVLGASVSSIAAMMSKKFLRPVFIASLLAFPVAWWAMHQWLQDFPYKVAVSWWVFVLATVVAMVIAFITVSFQTIKAALMNPVRSLRTE